jgi:hypothetical protein
LIYFKIDGAINSRKKSYFQEMALMSMLIFFIFLI